MSDMVCLLLAFAFVASWTLLFAYGYFEERRDWNNGICRHSGEPWEYFDFDSQCGRGYRDSTGNCIWVSWPGVDKRECK